LNDPDVFLLREDNIMITETQRETLSIVNHTFGSLIFTSDNIKKYDSVKNLMFDNIMDLKEKEIHSVESFKNGLVEVLYSQDKNKYIAIINLKNKSISYNNKFSELKEIYFNKVNQDVFIEKILKLQPYESRLFVIKERL